MFGEIIRNFRLNNGLSQAAFVELIQKKQSKLHELGCRNLKSLGKRCHETTP